LKEKSHAIIQQKYLKVKKNQLLFIISHRGHRVLTWIAEGAIQIKFPSSYRWKFASFRLWRERITSNLYILGSFCIETQPTLSYTASEPQKDGLMLDT